MKFVEAYKIKVNLYFMYIPIIFLFYLYTIYITDINTYTSNNACGNPPLISRKEQYDHLDEADVTKVDKITNDAMIWMNSAMNQAKQTELDAGSPLSKLQTLKRKPRWDTVYETILGQRYVVIGGDLNHK